MIIGLTIILIHGSCGKSSNGTSSNNSCGTSDYCIIFVSDTTIDGDIDGTGDNDGSNGIEEADTICNADSNKPNSSTYKAMIIDGTNRVACTTSGCSGGTGEHVDWVLQASTEYRRSDGSTTIGTTTTAGVFSFPLNNSIDPGAPIETWTGLNETSWITHSNTCASWTDDTASKTGRTHPTTEVDLISNYNSACNGNHYRLYCVEQ